MKHLLICPFLLAAGTITAQSNSGRITYRETISLNISEADMPEGMAAFLPKEHKIEKTLFYNNASSLYENTEAGNGSQASDYQEGEVSVHLERKMPEEKVFLDLVSKKMVAQKDLMGRLFLVSDVTKPRKWKLTGRQKRLLDRPCMEAIAVDGPDSVTAWYTTAIPVGAGPQDLSGLPGMILEAWEGSLVHIVATAIDQPDGQVLKEKLKPPTKGKKVTAEAFEALSREKEKELQQQLGGGKGVMIHTITR